MLFKSIPTFQNPFIPFKSIPTFEKLLMLFKSIPTLKRPEKSIDIEVERGLTGAKTAKNETAQKIQNRNCHNFSALHRISIKKTDSER